MKTKNPHAVALGKIGGSKTSEKKKAAAKRNIEKRWDEHRRQNKTIA